MIVRTKPLKIKLKETENPLEDFMLVKNKNSIYKEVLFIRYIGIPHSTDFYIDTVLKIDHCFSSSESASPYLRLQGLEIVSDLYDINRLSNIWENWKAFFNLSSTSPSSLYEEPLCGQLENDTLEWTKKLSFMQILTIYKKTHPHSSETLFKNFVIKFLYWMDIYLPRLFKDTNISPKIVFLGDIKQHELLFLLFLSRLGCDIIYMNPKEDIITLFPEIEEYSTLFKCGTLYPEHLVIPSFSPAPIKMQAALSTITTTISRSQIENPAKQNEELTKLEEYSYEQLASLSSSVVMIKNCDRDHNVICYGSGVVIHSKGYILTNLHVVEGGHHFSVLYENETEEYVTDHFIKYHQQHDLAIIKVEKHCSPLTVKADGHLVRGQKIVAIGSPLGLFNSVSDGIVSGFREIKTMSMIQFTAPISDGSSGGALLDMYGRLVGLITAGFDKGQNLNLAVPSDKIYQFAQNFIEHTN